MQIEPYLEHIPEIERRLRLLKPDAIVFGCGPTSWLMPWIDQRLIQDPRRFGVHDIFRILPVDDLIIMDPPYRWLHDGTERFKTIIESRPKRWWFYPTAWSDPKLEEMHGFPWWHKRLPPCVRNSVTVQPWQNFPPGTLPLKKMPDGSEAPDKNGWVLDGPIPQTTSMSPVGATTLAWHLGCRRIGVVGMDATMASHESHANAGAVHMFMKCISKKAKEAGGLIWNLSPISRIKSFDPDDSASSSGPTAGNETQEPKQSSNTLSASTQPVT